MNTIKVMSARMSEEEILRQFKEGGVTLTELERRSGFSRKKVTRICREVLPQKRGRKTRCKPGALDILRVRVASVFDLGRLAA